MAAILGKKLGMSQIFTEEGDRVVVTVIEAGPCTVTQVKTRGRDGYEALQIGFGSVKPRRVNKPAAGHFKKAGVEVQRHLAEIRCDLEEAASWVKRPEPEEKPARKGARKAKAKARKAAAAEEKVVEEEAEEEAATAEKAAEAEAKAVEAEAGAEAAAADEEAAEKAAKEEEAAEEAAAEAEVETAPPVGGPQVGDRITVEAFEVGAKVKVTGVSKGKGFAGVIKRHGFAGGPGSHGAHFHRAPGSVGASAYPSRVFKGLKLPGQMGNRKSTQLGLKVVATDPEQNLLMVKGAIPGASNGLVFVQTQ